MNNRQTLQLALCVLIAGLSGGCGAASESGEAGSEDNLSEIEQGVAGYYEIHPRHSDKCMDVYLASGANGASVVQWSCTGGTNQQWRLENLATGYYALHPRHSEKCLDVYNAGTGSGTPVVQWQCTGLYNQQWSQVVVDTFFVELHPRHNPTHCLDVNLASLSNGAIFQTWPCTGAANQQFYAAPTP